MIKYKNVLERFHKKQTVFFLNRQNDEVNVSNFSNKSLHSHHPVDDNLNNQIPKLFKEPYELDNDPGRYTNGIIMEKAPFYERSFKTPTLRNIELTGPYMHNGSFQTLEEVIDFYDAGGGIGVGLDVPYQTLPSDSLHLTDREKEDIIHFLKALTDTTGVK